MTHHIKHPENCPLLEDLHNHLWKNFPMDRFEFIASSGESVPVYSGTTLPIDPVFTVIRGEAPRVGFFDEVSKAVRAFLCERRTERPADVAADLTAERKIA